MKQKKLKIGISACLMGFRYRYDGLSKLDRRVIEALDGKVDLIPVCPEVECGLEIPRPKMRLEATSRGTRMKVIESGEDMTDRMIAWADHKLEQLSERDITAFLFKSKSPSCGLASTKVFCNGGNRLMSECGTGIFAKVLTTRFPRMIVGEELDLDEFLKRLGLDESF